MEKGQMEFGHMYGAVLASKIILHKYLRLAIIRSFACSNLEPRFLDNVLCCGVFCCCCINDLE